MTDDGTPDVPITKAEVEQLLERMLEMEVEFAEERTRFAADAMLAAHGAQESAHEVSQSLEAARAKVARLKMGLLATFVASTITAYGAVYFHEIVRSGCYQVESVGPSLIDVRRPDAPWYCFVFPGTGVSDSQHNRHEQNHP